MNWIPTSERLPDDDLLVLVYAPVASEPVWPAWHDGDVDCWIWGEGATVEEKVTHWMALPEPPQAP